MEPPVKRSRSERGVDGTSLSLSSSQSIFSTIMKIVLTTLSLCVAAVAATSAGHHVHSNKDTIVSRALNERHDRNQERKKRNRGKHLNGGVDIERTPRGVEKPKRRGNPENLDAVSTPKQQLKGLEAEELELAEETKIAKHEARKKEKQRKRHKNETEVGDEGTFEDLEVEETHEDLATANVTETTATMSAEAPPTKTQTFAASIQEKHGKPVKSDRNADKDKPGPGPANKGEDQAEAAAASQQLENNSSSKKATILVSSMLGGAFLMFLM